MSTDTAYIPPRQWTLFERLMRWDLGVPLLVATPVVYLFGPYTVNAWHLWLMGCLVLVQVQQTRTARLVQHEVKGALVEAYNVGWRDAFERFGKLVDETLMSKR